MIQRLQSIFLLGAGILMVLILFFPIWQSSDMAAPATAETRPAVVEVDAFSITYFDGTSGNESSVAYIAALAILSALTAFFTIFRFRNRIFQMRLGAFNLLLMSAVMGAYFIAIRTAKGMLQNPADGDFLAAFYFPILAIILTMLANRFIKKDEKLVRSVDRIR
ncbi:MAG: DUF4293 domain-containing protein [Cytophagaceae bacterium]